MCGDEVNGFRGIWMDDVWNQNDFDSCPFDTNFELKLEKTKPLAVSNLIIMIIGNVYTYYL